MVNAVEIVPYQTSYDTHFYDLNIEWLQTFFYVEDHDEEVLSNPKTHIIDNGGHIFFAIAEDKVIGTVALIKMSKNVFELSKMAVLPECRGMKVGQKLMKKCIDLAKDRQWEKLVIYSNTKLENAIYIYRKYGFEEIELEKGGPYDRGDIKMELTLKS